MNIERLELINYRCFAEKVLDFGSGFNVLVGDNGSGKSAILDGLASAIDELIMNG